MAGGGMREQLERLRDEALRRKVWFGEARFAAAKGSGVVLQDGRADRIAAGERAGVGIRVVSEGAWGFASVESTRYEDWAGCLDAAMEMARVSALRQEEPVRLAEVPAVVDDIRACCTIDPAQVSLERKLAALRGYEEASACYAGEHAANLRTGYHDSWQAEIVCNTRGTLVSMESVRTLLWHSITAQSASGGRQRAREVRARQCGFELVEQTPAKDFAGKAARRAVSLLWAQPAPAGKFPVVFHPSITGLLVHEAIGHNAEADLVISGKSILCGKLGAKVAADCVTIIDDATIPGEWGTYRYDSEGCAGQRRVLVEQGVLKSYLHSLQTAAKMGLLANGSARADGFMNRPIVRMSNTIMQPGEALLEDLIADIDVGLLLQGGEWGYMWSERGQYTCRAGEGVMIRNGQLAERVRDVSISGMTLETLANVLGISRDFELGMPGNCGKDGQNMSVNGGGPYVKVKEIVVGGQA